MKKLLIVPLLLLAGCVGSAEVRVIATLAIACDTYATVLKEATVFRREGRLSANQIAIVDKANAVASPACSADSQINPADGVRIVRSAVDQIKSVTGAS